MIAFLWNEAKGRGRGRKVGEILHLQSGRIFQHRNRSPGGLSSQESTQDPSLAQSPLIAQRQLAEAALSRAAAPQQHHPWLMCSRWKSFLAQKCSQASAGKRGPSPCSALGHLGTGAGLATLSSEHTAARGQGQHLALEHCAVGCEAQRKIQEMREGAQDELHRVHSGKGLAAAATSNISLYLCVPQGTA